jgi:hypothetical protein
MTQTIPEERTKLYHILADETCQTKHRWMAIGATVVSDEHADHVRAKFRAWKKHMGLQGEIKWNSTKENNVDRYKTMVKIYMALVAKGIIRFHAILICMDVVDYGELGDEVPELSYNRFFHHLLMKLCRICPRENRYRIKFDERDSKIPMRPFQDAANFAAKRDYGLDHWPVRSLQYENSKNDILLQVNDLVLGAVGFLRNGKHKVAPTMDSPKHELAIYIRQASPAHSFWQNTAADKKDFTLWALRFDGKKGKEAFRNRDKFKPRAERAKRKAAKRRKRAAPV